MHSVAHGLRIASLATVLTLVAFAPSVASLPFPLCTPIQDRTLSLDGEICVDGPGEATLDLVRPAPWLDLIPAPLPQIGSGLALGLDPRCDATPSSFACDLFIFLDLFLPGHAAAAALACRSSVAPGPSTGASCSTSTDIAGTTLGNTYTAALRCAAQGESDVGQALAIGICSTAGFGSVSGLEVEAIGLCVASSVSGSVQADAQLCEAFGSLYAAGQAVVVAVAEICEVVSQPEAVCAQLGFATALLSGVPAASVFACIEQAESVPPDPVAICTVDTIVAGVGSLACVVSVQPGDPAATCSADSFGPPTACTGTPGGVLACGLQFELGGDPVSYRVDCDAEGPDVRCGQCLISPLLAEADVPQCLRVGA